MGKGELCAEAIQDNDLHHGNCLAIKRRVEKNLAYMHARYLLMEVVGYREIQDILTEVGSNDRFSKWLWKNLNFIYD